MTDLTHGDDVPVNKLYKLKSGKVTTRTTSQEWAEHIHEHRDGVSVIPNPCEQ